MVPLLYKETLFFVLHEEFGKRVRPRACALHVGCQELRALSRPPAFEVQVKVQTTMEARVGSK
jgi:hypothetical protein